ncbi:hypothetical protein CEW92_13730 [Bacillaceae bacterium SAS-127]|nr:hypothetical protein CEW92_13730 [Bacillaceae bacterium SAS-127]
MNNSNNLERQLHTFIQVSKNITNNRSLTQLIQEIIEEVIEAIDKADAGFLLLWDEGEEVLTIEAAVNFKEEMYLNNKLLSGEGISGTVFATGKSLLINGESNIQAAMSNMRNKTFQYYLKSTVHAFIPKSCVSVPLIHQQKKIGVLTIDNFHNNGFFSQDDLSFLEAIGSQIAISIVNARTFYEKQLRTKQLETTLTLHNQLNEAALKGNGLKSLVERLAKIVQSRIYYFDPLFRVELAYSRSNEDVPFFQEWLRHHSEVLNTSQHLFPIVSDEQKRGYALSIQSSFGTIGYLVIDGNTSPLDIVKELTIKHAASIIAIEQMKFQEQFKYEKEEKGKLLVELLQQNLTSDVQFSLRKFGILKAHSYRFLAVKNKNIGIEDVHHIAAFEQVMTEIFSKDYYVVTFPHEQAIFVLLGAKNEEGVDRLDQITLLADRLLLVYPNFKLFIGRSVRTLQHVSISHKDAELLVMEEGYKREQAQIRTFKELGIKRYLMTLNEESRDYFIEDILGPVLPSSEHEVQNELLSTLRSYFESHKNVALTAERLHLHQNTVYYRLQQLQGKLNCSFDNLNDLTNIQAALFLLEWKNMIDNS